MKGFFEIFIIPTFFFLYVCRGDRCLVINQLQEIELLIISFFFFFFVNNLSYLAPLSQKEKCINNKLYLSLSHSLTFIVQQILVQIH